MRVLTMLATAIGAMALVGQSVIALSELRIGDPAPQFSLTASDGKTYRLADYRGKQAVVLAWFAKAFTSG